MGRNALRTHHDSDRQLSDKVISKLRDPLGHSQDITSTDMKMFQVRQTITYELTMAAGTEQEAVLKAKVIPLAQWTTEAAEITTELLDETDEIDDY